MRSRARQRSFERRLISFRQLCAIARVVLTQAPAAPSVDVKDAIKTRVLQLGFLCPTTEMLVQALDQVEAALAKTRAGHMPARRGANPAPSWGPMRREQTNQFTSMKSIAATIRSRFGFDGLSTSTVMRKAHHETKTSTS